MYLDRTDARGFKIQTDHIPLGASKGRRGVNKGPHVMTSVMLGCQGQYQIKRCQPHVDRVFDRKAQYSVLASPYVLVHCNKEVSEHRLQLPYQSTDYTKHGDATKHSFREDPLGSTRWLPHRGPGIRHDACCAGVSQCPSYHSIL
jgi:hypothetical protein